ncbi:hypothetical protein E2I00_010744, partial [Balaenoptera physalus]
IRSSDKVELPHRRPSFNIPQSYRNEPEENMTIGSLSRMLSEIRHSVESEVDPFVSLTRHSSSIQVKDNISPPETITIREIFKAPCLQSLTNLESLVNTFTSDLMQKLSLRQKSAILCQQIHENRADVAKSQVATSEDEQVHTPINYADTNFKEDVGKSEVPVQTEILKSKLEVNVLDPVPITAQSKLSQIDPLANLIEQLRTELIFLRSPNEAIAQDLLIKEAQSRNAEIELERHRSQAERVV